MNIHFLLAEWNNLILANYVVPHELLLPYVPFKTELDFNEGKAYLSLTGFMFLNTRMMGFSIPRHINFEEVNLRFYVKYNDHGKWKRGVVFIKQIVPRYAVSFVANNVFRENYTTLKMKHFHNVLADSFEAGYEWKYKDKWNRLSASAQKKSSPVYRGGHEEFITDHYWGYTKYSGTKTYEYEVEHRQWETFRVNTYVVDCDFGALYGDPFSFLNHAQPASVLMVKGSEIRVHQRKTLE